MAEIVAMRSAPGVGKDYTRPTMACILRLDSLLHPFPPRKDATMNKTLIALALSLGLGLAGCSQNASDQPENATANAPDTAAPSDTTASATGPSGNDSADATANTTGINPTTDATAMGSATDASGNAMGTDPAMGGTQTGGNSQYAANLDEELRRCDQLSGAERDTCRADAQSRYDQSNTGTPTTP
jgi:hypothetical protein